MNYGLHSSLFLTVFKDAVPPSKACLYGHINWSHAWAQQLSSFDLFQYSTTMGGGKARPKAGFQFNFQIWPMPDSSSGLLAKKLHLETSIESSWDSRKSHVHASGSSTYSREKGSHGQWHSWYVAAYNFINIFINCTGWYTSLISRPMEKYYFQ